MSPNCWNLLLVNDNIAKVLILSLGSRCCFDDKPEKKSMIINQGADAALMINLQAKTMILNQVILKLSECQERNHLCN